MIGRLRGKIISVSAASCLIEVGGVGYIVGLSGVTLSALPPAGQECILFVETIVREQAMELYGFMQRSEHEVFNLLVKIPGVGPRMALAILSVLPPEEMRGAVERQDRAAFGRASGVGPKIALRILTELKGKTALLPAGAGASPAPVSGFGEREAEIASALESLGFKNSEIQKIVRQICSRHPDAGIEESLSLCLQGLGRKMP